jgi:hypothetical protein
VIFCNLRCLILRNRRNKIGIKYSFKLNRHYINTEVFFIRYCILKLAKCRIPNAYKEGIKINVKLSLYTVILGIQKSEYLHISCLI